MGKMSKKLLKKIQTQELEGLYISFLELACEWAAAGFLEHAHQLLATLWQYTWPKLEKGQIYHDAFAVLWALTGTQPESVPVSCPSPQAIEQDTWARLCDRQIWSESFLTQFEDQPWQELRGNQLRVKGILLAQTHPEVALAALTHYFETEKAQGYDYFQASSCGALLAARRGPSALAETWLLRWAEGYLTFPENYILCYLLRDRSTASLLLTGCVAKTWKLTAKKTESLLGLIREDLAQRMAHEQQ